MKNLEKYLFTAIEAAKAAAQIQNYYIGKELEIDTKSSETDLVTKVDKLCEEKIREIIGRDYPEHIVLGEEQGQTGEASHRWIVDPLDGTLNYAHGFPFYCVSIALEIDGDVKVAVVLDSTRNELFTAIKGQGAFLDGAPIKTSSEIILKKSMLATGFAYAEDTISENLEIFARVHHKVRSIRRPGAAALDLCYVACGRLDAFWELKLNPWDVAAGVLIIEEATGKVTNRSGGEYILTDKVIIASNGVVHEKLVDLLDLENSLK